MSTTIFEMCNESHDALLARIRMNLAPLATLQQEMEEVEAVGVLRFYNSDLRVFDMRLLVERTAALFRSISPGGELALPFEVILQDSMNGRLDFRSSRMWVLSALPTLTAFYHCRFLVDQHVNAGREMEQVPDTPPAGWAVLLCLYCC